MSTTLYLVIPCYNEEEVLPETYRRLNEKFDALSAAGRISDRSRIMFVNDGSKDATWSMLETYYAENPRITAISLSRNKGHQNALLAGLMTAKEYADAVISMDADLQDDIDAIDRFLDEFEAGAEIVYGVRSSRATDTAFKRGTAQNYYKFLTKMGVETVYNAADYRLMSKRALDALAGYKESGLFLRGIVPTIGFKTAVVEFERHERFAGTSKYPLKKMLNLASDGVTAFSVKPLRMIFIPCLLFGLLSVAYLIYALVVRCCGGAVNPVHFISMVMMFFTAILLGVLGIIAEYIGKINLEVRERPRYFIKDIRLQ